MIDDKTRPRRCTSRQLMRRKKDLSPQQQQVNEPAFIHQLTSAPAHDVCSSLPSTNMTSPLLLLLLTV